MTRMGMDRSLIVPFSFRPFIVHKELLFNGTPTELWCAFNYSFLG